MAAMGSRVSDRIAAIAPHLDASDAQVVDARGHVVMPGFVDTHRHTWQTQMRAPALASCS